ncbi:MAG: hypothetical protein P4L91_08510 [Burkholderiaceae bacterium]|nr:hypothetical protein [Burkholderiaceae bacterium]
MTFKNYVAYAFLILIYAAFAWSGKAPVDGLIAIITGALAALGAHQANASSAKRATDAANVANPVPPPKAVTATTTVSSE